MLETPVPIIRVRHSCILQIKLEIYIKTVTVITVADSVCHPPAHHREVVVPEHRGPGLSVLSEAWRGQTDRRYEVIELSRAGEFQEHHVIQGQPGGNPPVVRVGDHLSHGNVLPPVNTD